MLVDIDSESDVEDPEMIGSDIADEDSESEGARLIEPIHFGTVPPPNRNKRQPKSKPKAKASSKGTASKNSRKQTKTRGRGPM